MTNEQLSQRDYILLLDKSGSMNTKEKNGKTRWENAKEMTLAFANKCAEFDKDGITVMPFAGTFQVYKNITGGPEKVNQIFKENQPLGSTNTSSALQRVFDDYFANPAKPITVLVVTDGEPDNEQHLAQTIIDATKKMKSDEEIGVSFIQVGNDPSARAFLQRLDDNLQKEGAKFDIVDTKTFEEVEALGNVESVLIAAITD